MSAPIDGLPAERPPGRPFDPPAELAGPRESRPLTRMVHPDGHVGWLATSWSARCSLMHLPVPVPRRPRAHPVPAAARGEHELPVTW